MLLFAVPLIWLAIATFVVLLCRAAADGDAALLVGVKRAPASTVGRTRTTWRRPSVRATSHAGTGTRRPAARESDLLTRRGSE
jgi:hypothetical protein